MRRESKALIIRTLPKNSGVIILLLIIMLLLVEPVYAERIYFSGYNGGFYIKSEEEGGMELRLGGSFQSEYQAYAEQERADNRFDIRKARLLLKGQLTKWFLFNLEYEFVGNQGSALVDGYGEWVIDGMSSVRFGQYKEPFSLEWQTQDKSILFAERSMGYYLTPKRDIGIMFRGNMMQKNLNYSVGLFNGDGESESLRGDEEDSPEICGRLTVKPFGTTDTDLLRNFQIGTSASYAKIEPTNVNIKVKSTGMAGLSNRYLYDLAINSNKFGVIKDVDSRIRGSIETAWTYGSFVMTGEYMLLKYSDLDTAETTPIDADFSSWYVSAAYCLTGEEFSLAGGVLNSITPSRFFDPDEGTHGAVILAARFEHFSGDEDWVVPADHVSVRDADAVSVCATWILFPMLKVIADYSYTDLSDPIKVRVNDDGSIDYIDKENVFTMRFNIDL